MSNIVDVAAAVIVRPDGHFLLGRRPPGTPWAGYWEFPGGKLEAGETAAQALVRELREELGIEVGHLTPWIRREHVYPHAHVRLHFFRVTAWQGALHPLHHDALAWQRADCVDVSPMLPANAAVLRALTLPDMYAITHAGTIGIDRQLERIRHALVNGLRLVQIREPLLTPVERESFARQATRLAHARGARVLINGDIELAQGVGADGVHLPAAQLMQMRQRPAAATLPLVAASCHSAAELAHAGALDLDFAVLGSVKKTPSHPGAPGLGWERVAQLLADTFLPVYILGGLGREDRVAARTAGAHGIAAIRAAWS